MNRYEQDMLERIAVATEKMLHILQAMEEREQEKIEARLRREEILNNPMRVFKSEELSNKGRTTR